MRAQSCDITHAGSDITGFCGRPGRHSASPGAEQPDRHAGEPVRAGSVSSCHHPSSLLPAPSQRGPSPGRRSWPGSWWALPAAAHVSVGEKISHQGPVCKLGRQHRNRFWKLKKINYNNLQDLSYSIFTSYVPSMYSFFAKLERKMFENSWITGKGGRKVKSDSTNPGLPLSIQRAPRLLLEKGVCTLKRLVLSGQLTETKLWLFTRHSLYLSKI